MSKQNTHSILEIYDLATHSRTVVREYPYLIEAPNWSVDGGSLIYNSRGLIYRLDLESREERVIPTGYANRCNNDHVLSADGAGLAISHQTEEDGQSRIYTLRLEGGNSSLDHPSGAQLSARLVTGWGDAGVLCGAGRGVRHLRGTGGGRRGDEAHGQSRIE